MAVLHIGTATTLATVLKAGISNNDVAYIWLNSYTRKMVYDSTATFATDTTNHPYYIRPGDYAGAGVWIEEVGADQPEAWSANQIVTGQLTSTNWAAAAGSQYDLDLAKFRLGGSNVDAAGSAAGIFMGLDSGAYKFYVGDGSTKYFKFDATDFTINLTNLVIDSSTQTIKLGTGNDIISLDAADATYRLAIGHATYGSAPFRVTKAGVLTATGAVITGNLTATTGTIGGWTVLSTELHNTNLWLDAATKQIAIGSQTFGNSGIQLEYNAGTPRAYVGDGANAFFQFDGTKVQWKGTNSELDASGNLVCTGGTIGGFTLAATTLTATNLLLDAGNQEIKLGTGNDIISLDAADATYRLAIGHATYGSAPFRVTKAGVLTATGATISGAITAATLDIGGDDATSFHVDIDGGIWSGAAIADKATAPFRVSNAGALVATSGTIGGWALGATSLTSTNIGLHSGANAEILLGHATTYASAKIGLKNDGSGKLASGGFLWDTSGNINIVTTGPGYPLQINVGTNQNFQFGTFESEGFLTIKNDANDAYVPMRIYASEINLMNGDVGINDSTPSYRLEVNGTSHVTGEFTAGTKTFLIDHPVEPYNKVLYHATVEAPRHDLIYRGVGRLTNGIVEIDINANSYMSPGTFETLCQNAEVVSLQNQDSFDRVKPSVIQNGRFTIICENPDNSTDYISWVVMAERKDPLVIYSGLNDNQGRLIVEVDKIKPTKDELKALEKTYQETDNIDLIGTIISERVDVLKQKKGYLLNPECRGETRPYKDIEYKAKLTH